MTFRLKEEIKKMAGDIHPSVIDKRRYLHRHPELSFKEFNTSAFVKNSLDEMDIPWQPIAGTGVLAGITGDMPSDKVIALRADMDALPITEENKVDYTSVNTGVMHACGHDAHTSSLLGTAFILQKLKPHYGGTIKLLFQPGEEILPGGATLMIRDGALENPRPGAVIGQHVSPVIDAGMVGFRSGKFMASMDEITFRVFGKGGHGAQPQDNIDPVLITSHIIVALQQVVSRMAHPGSPTVLSFGKVIANGAINIIPSEVYVEGTFRAMEEKWRMKAHENMIKMATGIAESMGGRCEFKISKGYPFLLNHEPLTGDLKSYAEEYLGKENVLDLDIWMAAEDFAYYSQAANACFYLLGIRGKDGMGTSSLHSATFDIEESALSLSTGLMAYIALKRLGIKI
ncbi:MAG: M20 family metallopeptidase [Chitinophagaceae bacterium]|nr:M20 family metallopeptidase [Chitinophagaceae bacterium]